MYKIIKKQIRPNTSVPFYTLADLEFKAWLGQNYIMNGKMMPPEVTLSEDGLEQSTVIFFQSEDAAREWKYDAYVVEKLQAPMEAYCAANNIEILPTITVGEV